MTAEASSQTARQPVDQRILAASFLTMIALALAAVLLSTNLGVGIVSGSIDLVRSVQGDHSIGTFSPKLRIIHASFVKFRTGFAKCFSTGQLSLPINKGEMQRPTDAARSKFD